MELKQLYTDLILEYNKDKSNKRKIECPTVHEHGHKIGRASCRERV